LPFSSLAKENTAAFDDAEMMGLGGQDRTNTGETWLIQMSVAARRFNFYDAGPVPGKTSCGAVFCCLPHQH